MQHMGIHEHAMLKVDSNRVKSGKFGHQVNSDTDLQTVDIQMRRLLMSRLEPSHQDFHCLLS